MFCLVCWLCSCGILFFSCLLTWYMSSVQRKISECVAVFTRTVVGVSECRTVQYFIFVSNHFQMKITHTHKKKKNNILKQELHSNIIPWMNRRHLAKLCERLVWSDVLLYLPPTPTPFRKVCYANKHVFDMRQEKQHTSY